MTSRPYAFELLHNEVQREVRARTIDRSKETRLTELIAGSMTGASACGAPGRFELPPLPPEGDREVRRRWFGALHPRIYGHLERQWIRVADYGLAQVLPFRCHYSAHSVSAPG